MHSYTVRVYQETDDPDYRHELIGIVKDAHGKQCAFMGADELAQILRQDYIGDAAPSPDDTKQSHSGLDHRVPAISADVSESDGPD